MQNFIEIFLHTILLKRNLVSIGGGVVVYQDYRSCSISLIGLLTYIFVLILSY